MSEQTPGGLPTEQRHRHHHLRLFELREGEVAAYLRLRLSQAANQSTAHSQPSAATHQTRATAASDSRTASAARRFMYGASGWRATAHIMAPPGGVHPAGRA